jgi:hypothetical protein
LLLIKQITNGLRGKLATHGVDKKGRQVMMPKIILILIMGVTLAGAASSMPRTVTLVMGCLTLFALSIVMRSQRQELPNAKKGEDRY